jgi:C-terminal processing protease CtpA/Prc
LAFGIVAMALSPALDTGSSESLSAANRSSQIVALTADQVDNLVLLGKVWGFAKYHHPDIAGGRVDWDAELRRILPSLLRARGPVATTAIARWLASLDSSKCKSCAVMPEDPHLRPDVAWIRDERTLGRALSVSLVRIYDNRWAKPAQHYVTFASGVGNPVFTNEKEYADEFLPGSDLRLLALYRFWNIIEYWFPYRDLIEEDWDAVLREFVPRLWQSNDAASYRLTMMMLIARVHDGHANLWNSLHLRPPRGLHRLPVKVRFIEGKAVVTGFMGDTLRQPAGLHVGDVITAIGGQRVDSLANAWTPYYAASNQPARLRSIAQDLTKGPPGLVRVTGERDGSSFDLQLERMLIPTQELRAQGVNALPGEAFQLLTDEVAYLKLGSVSASQAAGYIRMADTAKVLVIDIRTYPREFVVFALGKHLVSQSTEFARFTYGDGRNPGAFLWTRPVSLQPAAPDYKGSIVILVDEGSLSQSEYTAMAFRAAPNSIVVGSTTAGADGNVSPIVLPGGLRSMISGIGVFYPDKRPTQRIGIVPDLVVHPTIAGIRQGRDEVLEAGVSRALGREFRLRTRPK